MGLTTAGATVLAAGISAAAGGASSGLGAAKGKRSQKRAYEYQSKLNEQAYQRNLQMMDYQNSLLRQNWDIENEYNSPAAQMERYKSAGLNPNLIYGQQNTAGSEIGTADAPDAAVLANNPYVYDKSVSPSAAVISSLGDSISTAVSNYQDSIKKTAQIEKLNGEVLLQEIEKDLKEAGFEGKELDNALKRIRNKYADGDYQLNQNLKQAQIDEAAEALRLTTAQINLTDAKVQDTIARTQDFLDSKDFRRDFRKATLEEKQQIVSNLRQAYQNQKALVDAQVDKLKAELNNIESSTELQNVTKAEKDERLNEYRKCLALMDDYSRASDKFDYLINNPDYENPTWWFRNIRHSFEVFGEMASGLLGFRIKK